MRSARRRDSGEVPRAEALVLGVVAQVEGRGPVVAGSGAGEVGREEKRVRR